MKRHLSRSGVLTILVLYNGQALPVCRGKSSGVIAILILQIIIIRNIKISNASSPVADIGQEVVAAHVDGITGLALRGRLTAASTSAGRSDEGVFGR